MHDALDLSVVRGRVHMRRGDGAVLFDGSNLVVQGGMELIVRALMGTDRITGVNFGLTANRAITVGTRGIGTPVANASVETSGIAPTIAKDGRGARTIGTWTAVLAATSVLTYDTLGLVSDSGLLFAALTFSPVTLQIGESVAVQWTILLRGA